ncbi:hypothetical protein C8J57DRAFT_1456956 [Mycena rebaudengoi]|nr:hypothetical protein C8J57DRAFT_1456956 [Mycena rebaudengoi]
MVALLKGIAAIAAATNVRIVDTLGGHALDLADNRCINFQPVQAANQAVGAPHQQFHIDTVDPVAGTFRIVHSACNFPITFAGTTSGAEGIRGGVIIVNNSPTTFRIVPADPTIPSGPFNLIETSSGLALTLWRYNPGTVMFAPATFENLIRGDTRQSFSFIAG